VEYVKVLVRVPHSSFGLKVSELETDGDSIAHVSKRVIRGARVAPRSLHVVLDDQTPALELAALSIVQAMQVALPVSAEHKVAARLQNPRELVHPRHLEIFGQVAENRERVNQVERGIVIGERGRESIDAGIDKGEVLAAPLDELRTVVGPIHPSPLQAMPVP
jgi:hypothetical protein